MRRGAGALAFGLAVTVLVTAGAVSATRKRPAQVAFVRYGPASWRLYVAELPGGAVKRITRENSEQPAWSPDGLRIAYSAEPVGRDLAVLTIASLRGPLHRLVSEDGSYYYPAWSPNGKLIAYEFVANEESETPAPMVGVVGADGRGRHILGDDLGETRPTWAPDSEHLAFAAVDGIRIASAAGGPTRLVAPSGAEYRNPVWSPRGTKIAFSSLRGIEVVAPDGTGHRLIARVRGAAHPAWSPRGRTIAFDDYRSDAARSAVYEVNPDGKGLRRMTKRDLVAGLPAWSPDGRRIAFVGFDSMDGGSIYVVPSTGGAPTRITPASVTDTEPVWRPR